MADNSKKSNINQQYNVATKGLNLDNSQNNIKKGALSYALNAAVENFDANSVNYQNEPGNKYCFDFPDGYVLIGRHFIPEQNRIIFYLTNSETGGNEIGQTVDNSCVYTTLVNDSCLNFDINTPILKIVHKITNFGTELYWPDNNGRRYIDIDNIPYIPLETSEVCDPEDSSRLDCNKILLQPDINIPFVSISDVISGGEITSGTYQFTVQYADAVGNPLTSYYGVTNPTPIADIETASVNFNLPVGKSIIVDVENLDPLGQYQYFNLAVIKTINNVSSPELVGTYFIDENNKQITYTGQIVTNIQLSIQDIFEKFTFYDNADYVTTVQDILVWKGMTAVERLNYQKIANEIRLKWQTYRIPAGESYADETNAVNLRGYLRDEVYAFEIVFLLKSGKETDGFHIPGRMKGTAEQVNPDVAVGDLDYIGDGETPSPYWVVYNTASVETTSPEYGAVDYKGPYQSGEFAYWESTEEYPCDEEVWGELANQKIRHHKFPDVSVSPIIEGSQFMSATTLQMEDVAIFPIGVKIDSTEIASIIQRSELTQAQKDDIVGYRIARADRGVNKSIVAKGMLRNVNKYTRQEQDYYYPNYPYNDLKEDPFLNVVNNAWTALCEEYTIQIFNLPDQGDGNYVTVEYTSCDNNKRDEIRIDEIGISTICSVTKPRFTSLIGEFNKSTNPTEFAQSSASFYDANWQAYIPQPDPNTDGCIYPSNYDVYRINWKSFDFGSAGMRPEWECYIEGTRTVWLTYRDDVLVAVPVGSQPVCTDSSCFRSGSGNNKMRDPILIEEVRVSNCTAETPGEPLETATDLLDRQVFNSPETSFGQPFLGSILKLESVMYGAGKAHFVEVKNNAKYRLITEEAQRDALSVAEDVADLTATFSLESMFAVYNAQLTIFRNDVTKRNYARSFNSIASYNYTEPIPNNIGAKNFNLDIKRYLIPEVLNVGDDNNINNFQRETSVYLKSNETIPIPNTYTYDVEDRSRFTISEKNLCSKPEKEEDISVVSYYGSLKNQFVNQYGQIYSYESIDTGFVKIFNNLELNEDVVWGGDTFIGRFAYKTKVPFFIDNRVDGIDDSDIFYDEIGNIAYPKYWHSSRSILKTWYGTTDNDFVLPNFISYKAHNFDCPNSQELIPEDADPSTNPDRTFYDGYYYLFAYGIPSFYCESSYNLDLRTAFNNKEGDFWPHVSSGIPDNWVQETNTTIAWDNTYNYNVTFSKQNKETVFTTLPADWGTGEDRIKYPFRTVYSDKQVTDADNRVNNWLTYRAVSYFDFPQNFGGLTALDGIKDSAILARFENKSLLYNNLLTIDTSNPQAAYIGNSRLFTGSPPIDYADTDQGYVGAQNKMLLKTPYGAVSVDAKRGQVFLINGTQLQDLSQFGSGMQRWFTAHLPFEILNYFPGINTDNHYNSVGLHGVYDSNYERLILTKIDYVPLKENIEHRDNKWYITENNLEKEIYLIDSDYFCNVSWTLSFNFNTKSWISFHSYIPNFYVGENNFFYSGLNNCPNDFDVLVGVIDNNLTTTTTTTVRILPSTTTTTSTTAAPFDCSFDAVAEQPDCDIEGSGYYVDAEPIDPCIRLADLEVDRYYWGYDLTNSGLSVDSRASADSACSHINYYLADEEVWGYVGKYFEVETQGEYSGASVYLRNFTNDCTTIADGWYFSNETAANTTAFRVESGQIIEMVDCNTLNDPTTTTTTTTLVTASYCYTGIYTEPDLLNPLGGIVNYLDEFGNPQTASEIWDVDTIQIEASTILSTSGVTVAVCTTTTTTTV